MAKYSEKSYGKYRKDMELLIKNSNTTLYSAAREVLLSHHLSQPEKDRLDLEHSIRASISRWTDLEIPTNNQTFISLDTKHLFSLGTINTIIGSRGTHKSRLAHCVAAAILRDNKSYTPLKLNVNKDCSNEDFLLCWFDTEHSTRQFALVKERIKKLSGLKDIEHDKFLAFSFNDISISKRFSTLDTTVKLIKSDFPDKNIVFIIDTITDIVPDYNNLQDSVELLALLLGLSNSGRCTFLCVIHETHSSYGKSSKARGHVGSELENKSSTILRVSKWGKWTLLENTKNREAIEIPKTYLAYDEQSEGLRTVNQSEISQVPVGQKRKIDPTLFIEELKKLRAKPQLLSKFNASLANSYNCTTKTVQSNVDQFIYNKSRITIDETAYILKIKGEGKARTMELHKSETGNN